MSDWTYCFPFHLDPSALLSLFQVPTFLEIYRKITPDDDDFIQSINSVELNMNAHHSIYIFIWKK